MGSFKVPQGGVNPTPRGGWGCDGKNTRYRNEKDLSQWGEGWKKEG